MIATISAASATTPPPALPHFLRDTLPGQAVRLDKIVTGTYNVPGNYKVVYKTNPSGGTRRTCGGQPEHPAELCIGRLQGRPVPGLQRVRHRIQMSFGVVPASFRQVEAPQVYATV